MEGEGNLLGFSFSETTYSAALFQNYRFWSELLQLKPIRSWVFHVNRKPFCFVLLVLYFPSFILLFSSEKKVKEVKIFFESGFSECWSCSRDDKILFFKSTLLEHRETYLTLTAGEKNYQGKKKKAKKEKLVIFPTRGRQFFSFCLSKPKFWLTQIWRVRYKVY